MLEIIWNNILAFPANMWNDIMSFFASFYNPNKSILENIFYNEVLWVGLAIWLYIKNGGQGGVYIILTFPLIWLIFHIMIVYLGIEVFFLLFVTVTACFYWRKGLNNILGIIFKILKYVVLFAIASYIILAIFGPQMYLIAIMISIIVSIISIINNYRKRRDNNI